MEKQKKSTRQRINEKMKEIRDLKQVQRSEYTHIRVSRINTNLIDDIWATLESDHRKEMNELNIKNLSRDDAITALLLVGMSQFNIPVESLDSESRYLRIVELQEHNNIMSGE